MRRSVVQSAFAGVAIVTATFFAWGPVAAQARTPSAIAGTGIAQIPVGSNPSALAVDARTDTIYVANFSSGTVSVVDGASATVTHTITVGTDPASVVLDEDTNTVYVANEQDGTVSVIDGGTDTVTDTIPIGNVPGSPIPGTDALAIDPTSDTVYVAWHDGIAVIDGATDDVTYPSTIFALGTGIDDSMAFDAKNHDLYLVDFINDQAVQVIDTSDDQTTSPIPVGEDPVAVAVNTTANTLYAVNCAPGFFNGIWVINAADGSTDSEIKDGCPEAVATDAASNTAYVLDGDTGALSVINGVTFAVTVPAISVGKAASAVAVDPDTGVVYVTDRLVSGTLTALTLAAPAISSRASVSFGVGKPGSFQVRTSGNPRSAVTERGPLPAGVTLTASGLLSGTPASGTGGTYAVTISASNGIGHPATQAFTLTVDQKPKITSPGRLKLSLGHKAAFRITSSGFPAPRITEQGKLPGGIKFSASKAGMATLTGMPVKSAAGHTFVVTITARNSTATVTQKLTIAVG
jgi:YVTN family beta-propeller protein